MSNENTRMSTDQYIGHCTALLGVMGDSVTKTQLSLINSIFIRNQELVTMIEASKSKDHLTLDEKNQKSMYIVELQRNLMETVRICSELYPQEV